MVDNNVLLEKFRRVKMLIMDTDGVMTNGQIIFTNNGDELKNFDVKDGFGIRLAHRAGIKTAIITGRLSACLARRAQELEIEEVHQKALVKADVYEELVGRLKLKHQEVAYMGDDIVDLPVMRQVGLSIAVPEAVDEVLEQADYITKKSAGQGAVRETVELILKTQGLWEKATERYFK